MNTEDKKESAAAVSSSGEIKHAVKAANFITGLLTGWGVPAAWAKALSGAIIGAAIGALVAAGVLTSCTTSYTQRADGSIEYHRTISIPKSFMK